MVKYLTYFDRNYLARGILMIESLRTIAPRVDIIVFALDAETERLLGQVFGDNVTVLPPDYVAQRWPNLEGMRTIRKHWEFIAMRKPCLLCSVLREVVPKGDILVYIDADCQFYSSPTKAIELMDGASIGISPHGFSERHKGHIQFGEFNAGFIIIRNDETGLTCMRDWADDCLNWCYAKVDGEKFMNQGYLTRWPHRYPDVVHLDQPGLNLAPWNFEGRTFGVENGEIYVDGEPLIFYHFHDMKRISGEWRNSSSMIDAVRHTSLFQVVYEPHRLQLKAIEKRLIGFGFDVKAPMKNKMDLAGAPNQMVGSKWRKKLIEHLAVSIRRVFGAKGGRN